MTRSAVRTKKSHSRGFMSCSKKNLGKLFKHLYDTYLIRKYFIKYFKPIQKGTRKASLKCSRRNKSDQELSCFITQCTGYCSFHNTDLHYNQAAAAGFVEVWFYCKVNICSTLILKIWICVLAFSFFSVYITVQKCFEC